MNNTATNTATCPTVRKQIGKTTYIVRVHFSETAKETMEDKIKRMLREEVRKMLTSLWILKKTLALWFWERKQREDFFVFAALVWLLLIFRRSEM